MADSVLWSGSNRLWLEDVELEDSGVDVGGHDCGEPGLGGDGEICACDLPELFDRSQPTMSHHLGPLVKAGTLDREQRGKWAWFSLRPERLEALRALLAT